MAKPEDYYKKTFPEDYKTFGDKGIRTIPLFSFETVMMLMELYHNEELMEILKHKTEKHGE